MDALGMGRDERAHQTDTDQAHRLIATYGGPAVIIDSTAAPLAASEAGETCRAALETRRMDGFEGLLRRAQTAGGALLGEVSCPGDSGTHAFEVSLVPLGDGGHWLALFRDRTLDTHLRNALSESRQRYKDLVEISSDFGWETGSDGSFIFISPAGALDYRAAELIGRRPDELVRDPEDYAPLPFACRHPVEGVEVWMRRADGGESCLRVSALPLRGAGGAVTGARGLCRDITREREQEAALSRARHREQLVNYVIGAVREEMVPQDMLSAATTATARAMGASGCRVYRRPEENGYSASATFGDEAGLDGLEAYLPDLQRDASTYMAVDIGGWTVLAEPTRHRGAINGAIAAWRPAELGDWAEEDIALLGDVATQLGIAIEQINTHDRILALSRSDELTGLLNRRAFIDEDLPRRLNRLQRAGRTAALFYVDLDNFKPVNDAFGHHRGDEVLFRVRDMLIEHSRPRDVIARLGGDEFAMWLDGAPPEVARHRAQALVTASRSLAAYSGAGDRPLGLSIGVAIYDPATGETLNDLLVRADSAMYAVKRRGKGGFEVAPPPGALRPLRDGHRDVREAP